GRKLRVIAATSTPAALATKAATSTIPIVFTTADDPIRLGLVASLNRPGGNVTGVNNPLVELGSKQLGLIRELAPVTSKIAVLVNPNFPGTERQLRDVEAAAGVLALQLTVLRAIANARSTRRSRLLPNKAVAKNFRRSMWLAM